MWLLTNITSRVVDGWHNQLLNINGTNGFAMGLKEALSKANKDHCFITYKDNNEIKYSVGIDNCNRNKAVLCKTEASKPDETQLEDAFPCISKESKSRKKRQIHSEDITLEGIVENSNDKG